jgi:hypothetical protein
VSRFRHDFGDEDVSEIDGALVLVAADASRNVNPSRVNPRSLDLETWRAFWKYQASTTQTLMFPANDARRGARAT